MTLSNKIKLSTLSLISAMSVTSIALAGEWEDTMALIDNCYLTYEEDYKQLPDIQVADTKTVINVYDNASQPNNCAQAVLLAYSMFEEAGYFQIIEYRDDFHERKKSWNKVEPILTNWREQASTQHEGLRLELEKRKQIELQNTPKRSRTQIIIENSRIMTACRKEILKNNPRVTGLDEKAQPCAEANPDYVPEEILYKDFKCVGLCD